MITIEKLMAAKGILDAAPCGSTKMMFIGTVPQLLAAWPGSTRDGIVAQIRAGKLIVARPQRLPER